MLTAGFHLFPILNFTMKRFIKYSILFASIIAVLLGCCELMVRNSPNTYTMKKNWMISHSGGIKTLITGNSHSYYGIKPDAIGDSVFNIANVSQGHECDYFLLTKFEPQLANLKNLIVIIDESNIFDPPLEDAKEWFRAINYKIYYGYDKHSDLSIYNYEISNYSTFPIKFEKAKKYLSGDSIAPDCDNLGWGCVFTAPERFNISEMKIDAKKTLERHRCKNWENVDYNVQYLNKIGDWCKHHNVNIIVITTPMWCEYVNMISDRQLSTMYDVINQFVRKYNATYKDYMRDPRFQGRDFHDVDHLSDLGAEKFSRILKQDFPEL